MDSSQAWGYQHFQNTQPSSIDQRFFQSNRYINVARNSSSQVPSPWPTDLGAYNGSSGSPAGTNQHTNFMSGSNSPFNALLDRGRCNEEFGATQRSNAISYKMRRKKNKRCKDQLVNQVDQAGGFAQVSDLKPGGAYAQSSVAPQYQSDAKYAPHPALINIPRLSDPSLGRAYEARSVAQFSSLDTSKALKSFSNGSQSVNDLRSVQASGGCDGSVVNKHSRISNSQSKQPSLADARISSLLGNFDTAQASSHEPKRQDTRKAKTEAPSTKPTKYITPVQRRKAAQSAQFQSQLGDLEFKQQRESSPKLQFGIPNISFPKAPLPIPVPTNSYLNQARQGLQRLENPQPLLVIFDINGTLIHRPKRSNATSFKARPGLDSFLDHVFQTYTVMVWSSTKPNNLEQICNKLFTEEQRKQIVRIWGRESLDLTREQFMEKTQVYKRLQRVWNDKEIQKTYPKYSPNAQWRQNALRWDQSNTILIDDSRTKAVGQPFNLLEIPEFAGDPKQANPEVLTHVRKLLEMLSLQADVSTLLRIQVEKSGSVPSIDTNDAISTSSLNSDGDDYDPETEVAKRLRGSRSAEMNSSEKADSKRKIKARPEIRGEGRSRV